MNSKRNYKMKLLLIAIALLLSSCGLSKPPLSVKCPVALPEEPVLSCPVGLPKTEIELQKEFLKLQAACEEITENNTAVRTLWEECP